MQRNPRMQKEPAEKTGASRLRRIVCGEGRTIDERRMRMRVIIHDLGAEYEASWKAKCDRLIHAGGKYAGCRGCFGCWTKHPAECFIRDDLQDICRIVGRADELIIITENYYGTYSPFVKAVLDRSIGLSTPLSTYRGGQMHHTLRYGAHKIIKVYVYGNILEQERTTFEQIAKRNAINYGYGASQVVFVGRPEQLAGVME